MRLLTWNIRFGGIGPGLYRYDPERSPGNVQKVAQAILSRDADIVTLAEYRDAAETGGAIKARLREAGYTCYCSNCGLDKNGILVAMSRRANEAYDVSFPDTFLADSIRLDEIFRYRWLNLSLRGQEGSSFELLGIHIPDVRQSRIGSPEAFVRSISYKQIVWDALLGYARGKLERGEEAIIMGDFNTGLNREDKSPGTSNYYLSDRMAGLREMQDAMGWKWVDAWRFYHPAPGPEDYTWYIGQSGFRLDYIFLTPRLAEGLRCVEHSHEERKAGLSDHSMLLADVDI